MLISVNINKILAKIAKFFIFLRGKEEQKIKERNKARGEGDGSKRKE